MYGISRLEGFAALLRLSTGRILIPGKDEKRYAGETVKIGSAPSPIWQGWAIKEMLVKDYGCDEERVWWIPSEGTTLNAAEAACKYLTDRALSPQSVEYVTSYYHCARASNGALRKVGVLRPAFPAEAFTLASAMKTGALEQAEERLRSFGGHFMDPRVISEIRGLACDLWGTNTPQTYGW